MIQPRAPSSAARLFGIAHAGEQQGHGRAPLRLAGWPLPTGAIHDLVKDRFIKSALQSAISPHQATLDFLTSPDFALAAFKGQKLTLRDWNLRLRQPILLADRRVSVSPRGRISPPGVGAR